MKRRNTRGALAGIVNSTQQSAEDESEVGFDSGSDNDKYLDSVSDSDNDNSGSVSNEEDENNDNNEWVMEDDEGFPQFPNIPRFNGPPFEPKTNNSKKIFNISNPQSYSPLQWFLEYLSEEFWQKIVDFTNYQVVDDEWEDLTLSELWIFLALLFLRALKQPPSYRDLWSTNWKYYCEKLHTLTMTRRRFELIRKYIKFNCGLEDEDDSYWRVRVILNELKTNCERIVKPSQNLSLDEMSPSYRGRTRLTVSMKGKKSKKHFNIRAITLPNGTLYTFYLQREKITIIDNPDYAKLSKTSQSVVQLVSSLPLNWHHIFVDNLYSNVELFKYLYVHCKTISSGTWRTNNGVPDCLKLKKSTSKSFLESQETERSIAAINCSQDSSSLVVTGCSFYGTKGKHVHFLTTGRYDWDFVTGGNKQKTKLDAIHKYNALMHGNDILDSVLSKYSVYFRSNRWTMRIASWVIDVAVANGFINATYLGIKRNTDCLHAAWIGTLIDELINKSNVQFKLPTAPNSNLEDRLNKEHPHFPQHVGEENLRKMCVVCYKQHGKPRRSFYKCKHCGVGLCVDNDCFEKYHTQQDY